MNKLLLNNHLFTHDAVEKAALDYQYLSHIVISDKDSYIVCEFYDCKYDVLTTIKEFENYVIGLSSKGLSHDNLR